LEEYVVDIVKYTSGFIVRKIRRMKNICAKCDAQLTEAENEETSSLLKFKNHGMLLNASKSVRNICLTTEYVFRMNHDNIFTDKNILTRICMQTMNEIGQDSSIFNSDAMIDHIKNQNIFDNHRSQLMKLITECYITLRFHHFSKMHTLNIKGKNIRRQFSKLILFKNQ